MGYEKEERVRSLRICYTSDTHGHVYPIDYASDCPSDSGLLNLACCFEKDGNTLILDGGDTLQGTPFSQYYLAHQAEYDYHPMALAFNAAGYDYVTLGNHDFNYGYEALRDYVTALNARCLCANVEDTRGELGILKETVHTLANGLRIGITGVVTDYVNVWEQPQNLEQIRITNAMDAAREACRRLRPICDICICMYHGGFERDLQSGKLLSDTGENIAWRLCEELDFDLVLTGHQHMAVEEASIGGTWAVQPPAGAGSYIQVDICQRKTQKEQVENTADRQPLRITSRLLPAGDRHESQPYDSMLDLHQAVERWLDLPVGELTESIPAEAKLEAALHGSRLASLFNQVQLEATGADFSCTSLGNEPVGLTTPVTMRGITAAYLFANTLVVLEVNEAVLKAALERCASYFTLTDEGPVISEAFLKPKVEHYNYDFYAGLSYCFDLRRPVGQRVTKLTRADGTPLGEGTYRLCTSNYRATGTGGYDELRRCPVLWRGGVEMPELTAGYVKRHSPLRIAEQGNFTVIW